MKFENLMKINMEGTIRRKPALVINFGSMSKSTSVFICNLMQERLLTLHQSRALREGW
ncbi:hypothetical protein Plhal304r1_c052g0136791 [Plasmopara halstedii]